MENQEDTSMKPAKPDKMVFVGEDGKEAEMAFFRYVFLYFYVKTDTEIGDIVGGMHIANAVQQGLTYVSQKLKKDMMKSEKLGPQTSVESHLEPNHKVGAVTYSLTEIAEILHKAMRLFGLDDLELKTRVTWIDGVLQTVTHSSVFEDRLNELISGHKEFVKRKFQNAPPQTTNFWNSVLMHHQGSGLSSGVLMSPVKRYACAKSLGPLTQLICIMEYKDAPGDARLWRDCVRGSIAHLPFAESLTTWFSRWETDSQALAMMRLLGDVLKVIGWRQSHALALPAGAIVGHQTAEELVRWKEQFARFDAWDPESAPYAGLVPPNGLAYTSNEEGVLMYNAFMSGKRIDIKTSTGHDGPPTKKLKPTPLEGAPGTSQGTEVSGPQRAMEDIKAKVSFYKSDAASEIIFHAVFDSYKENIGLLKWMTNSTGNWKKKNEIAGLANLRESELVEVTNPKCVRYYSKPYQPDIFPRFGYGQVSTYSSFSGRHTTRCSKLLAYLRASDLFGSLDQKCPANYAPLRARLQTVQSELSANRKTYREHTHHWESALWRLVGDCSVTNETIQAPEFEDAQLATFTTP